MRPLIPFLLAVSCGNAQPTVRNLLTFSGGWSRQVGGYSFAVKQTAVGLGLSYGYRFHGHIQAESGLFTALDPTGVVCSKFGCMDIDDHFFWVPFGLRFVAPLYLDRIEFSGGGGGLYEKYTVGNSGPRGGYLPREGWGGYFVGSVAIALDHPHRFWLAATPRMFLANPGFARDRWFQISGEINFRFH